MQASRRGFYTSTNLQKAACSVVKPVHHLVKIDKSKLSPRFPELNFKTNDIRSPSFRPTATHQDRVREHYYNTVQSDLLLMNYSHRAETVIGLKNRPWDGSSPYHLNRPPKKPQWSKTELPDIKPITWRNIPDIESVVLNCYIPKSNENQLLPIAIALQLQQITGCKPEYLYSKMDIPSWKVRKGMRMGAKVELKGRPMSQFMSTLTEIVLPRIRAYKGIPSSSGNRLGVISFGLTPQDVAFFPELDLNQEAWPMTFGMHININTTARTDPQAKTLLSGFGFPICKK
ncbi:HEL285Wp [Eremothecium sinecaudum]|uniref:Large ribosomal subunit protein uL5m n=1 Tax=Eremothecium sinecaudum TaxID=45286 RepID=A0A0X8HSF2_9SACH|nr:HEL285Wp [Eremothecium sinecaudum]AMD20996.1 HEL285Wp [Eremothecium sinecaudum]